MHDMRQRGGRESECAGEDGGGTMIWFMTVSGEQGENPRDLWILFDDLGNPAAFTVLPAAGQERLCVVENEILKVQKRRSQERNFRHGKIGKLS